MALLALSVASPCKLKLPAAMFLTLSVEKLVMSLSKSTPCALIRSLVISINGAAPTILFSCVSLRPSSNDTNSWTSFCLIAFMTSSTVALLFSV